MRPSIPLVAISLTLLFTLSESKKKKKTINATFQNNGLPPPKEPKVYDDAFRLYRPSYHLVAPFNWLNDPCAPFYNGTHYHFFYQFSPYSYNWGNMTWGHVSSPDLIHWQDEPIAIEPDAPYDHLGAFTGSAIENGVNGLWTVFYTGVDYLPISWRTPYNVSAEHQNLATSTDGGHTWTKFEGNPVIRDSPSSINITGFRDPFMFRSEHMESLLKSSPKFNALKKVSSIYARPETDIVFATISSGDRNGQRGGRLLLYATHNFTSWDYLGEFFGVPGNKTLPGTHAAFGLNFEVANIFTFDNQTYYISLGTEGGRGEGIHDNHWSVWVSGKLRSDPKSGFKFVMENAGVTDYGTFYAANSFHDPVKNRRVVYGWSNDETESIREKQNWAGIITLPREMFEKTIAFVHPYSCSKVVPGGPMQILSETEHGCTLRTLGVRPIEETRSLRGKPVNLLAKGKNPRLFQNAQKCTNFTHLNESFISAVSSNASNHAVTVEWMPISGTTFELMVEFDVNQLKKERENVGRFGIVLRATHDMTEHTSIFFDWQALRIGVDRTFSSATNASYHYPALEDGPFDLLQLIDPVTSAESYETVRFHVYLDNSLLEVYVNERFAIATRIYPSKPDEAIYAGYFATVDSHTSSSPIYPVRVAKAFPMKALPFPGRPSESLTPPVFHYNSTFHQLESSCILKTDART